MQYFLFPALELMELDDGDKIRPFIKNTLEETKRELYVERTGLQLYLEDEKYHHLCQLLQSVYQKQQQPLAAAVQSMENSRGSTEDEDQQSSDGTGSTASLLEDLERVFEAMQREQPEPFSGDKTSNEPSQGDFLEVVLKQQQQTVYVVICNPFL